MKKTQSKTKSIELSIVRDLKSAGARFGVQVENLKTGAVVAAIYGLKDEKFCRGLLWATSETFNKKIFVHILDGTPPLIFINGDFSASLMCPDYKTALKTAKFLKTCSKIGGVSPCT